jgi:hypothetical protein
MGLVAMILMRKSSKKRRIQSMLSSVFPQDRQIPALVLQPESPDIEGFDAFIAANEAYTEAINESAAQFVETLTPGLKHHSIHCISFVDSFESLCHLTVEELGRLCAMLRPSLVKAFPRCPDHLNEGESHDYCSRVLKVFMTLYIFLTYQNF